MAIDDAYATAAEYRTRIDKSDTAEDTLIGGQLEMASRYFEERWGQYFNKDASVTTRVYFGNGSRCLKLKHPIASTTGLIVKRDTDNDGDFSDESALVLGTDFELRRNGDLNPDQGPVVKPWNELYIPPWATSYASWYDGYRVQVTAIHGWPSVPLGIKDLVCEWVAVWRGESIRTTARVNELDQVESVSPYHLGLLKRMERIFHPTGGVVVG